MENQITTQYLSFFEDWEIRGLDKEIIVKELKKSNFSDLEVEDILNKFEKFKDNKRIRKGFLLMGIGSFLGFLSCVFTMLDIMPDFRHFILYGLTTIGVSIAFIGCYLVFEK